MSARKDYTLVALAALQKDIRELEDKQDALAEQIAVKQMQHDAIVATLTPEQRAKLAGDTTAPA